MNDSAIRCVVDASVAIKLFVEQPQSDVATELFAQLGADPPATLYVPELSAQSASMSFGNMSAGHLIR